MELVEQRKEVRWLWGHYLVSQRRIWGCWGWLNRVFAIEAVAVMKCCAHLMAAAREKPRWGYRRLQIVLNQQGEHVDHKRIYRVYREAGLTIRRRARKRLLRAGSPRPALGGPNQEWALGFVHDSAERGENSGR